MKFTPPSIQPIGKISMPMPETGQLTNGIPFYAFNGAQDDILKIDLLFDAGRWTEPGPLVADAVARLHKSGTSTESAFQLSEGVDFYGTTIKAEAGYNTFTLTLVCLNRYLQDSLENFRKCLTDIIFPESELALHKAKSISRLRVNLEKNEYLADMALKKALFGERHPYGYDITEEYIQGITQNALVTYYKEWLNPQNAKLFIAGKYDTKELRLITDALGGNDWGKAVLPGYPDFSPEPTNEKNIQLYLPGSVQSSISLGMPLFNRKHPDFPGFVLLNTIYGGYFGSRLMQNIREEKGLTYGIYSSLQAYKHAGLWLISTETDVKHTATCLQEIDHEAARLRSELIGEEELIQARNYLLGKLLSRTDGPFNQAAACRSLLIEEVDIAYFDRFAAEIRSVDRYRLKQLAEQYLHPENMYRVVVS
jgi:zinc protease